MLSFFKNVFTGDGFTALVTQTVVVLSSYLLSILLDEAGATLSESWPNGCFQGICLGFLHGDYLLYATCAVFVLVRVRAAARWALVSQLFFWKNYLRALVFRHLNPGHHIIRLFQGVILAYVARQEYIQRGFQAEEFAVTGMCNFSQDTLPHDYLYYEQKQSWVRFWHQEMAFGQGPISDFQTGLKVGAVFALSATSFYFVAPRIPDLYTAAITVLKSLLTTLLFATTRLITFPVSVYRLWYAWRKNKREIEARRVADELDAERKRDLSNYIRNATPDGELDFDTLFAMSDCILDGTTLIEYVNNVYFKELILEPAVESYESFLRCVAYDCSGLCSSISAPMFVMEELSAIFFGSKRETLGFYKVTPPTYDSFCSSANYAKVVRRCATVAVGCLTPPAFKSFYLTAVGKTHLAERQHFGQEATDNWKKSGKQNKRQAALNIRSRIDRDARKVVIGYMLDKAIVERMEHMDDIRRLFELECMDIERDDMLGNMSPYDVMQVAVQRMETMNFSRDMQRAYDLMMDNLYDHPNFRRYLEDQYDEEGYIANRRNKNLREAKRRVAHMASSEMDIRRQLDLTIAQLVESGLINPEPNPAAFTQEGAIGANIELAAQSEGNTVVGAEAIEKANRFFSTEHRNFTPIPTVDPKRMNTHAYLASSTNIVELKGSIESTFKRINQANRTTISDIASLVQKQPQAESRFVGESQSSTEVEIPKIEREPIVVNDDRRASAKRQQRVRMDPVVSRRPEQEGAMPRSGVMFFQKRPLFWITKDETFVAHCYGIKRSNDVVALAPLHAIAAAGSGDFEIHSETFVSKIKVDLIKGNFWVAPENPDIIGLITGFDASEFNFYVIAPGLPAVGSTIHVVRQTDTGLKMSSGNYAGTSKVLCNGVTVDVGKHAATTEKGDCRSVVLDNDNRIIGGHHYSNVDNHNGFDVDIGLNFRKGRVNVDLFSRTDEQGPMKKHGVEKIPNFCASSRVPKLHAPKYWVISSDVGEDILDAFENCGVYTNAWMVKPADCAAAADVEKFTDSDIGTNVKRMFVDALCHYRVSDICGIKRVSVCGPISDLQACKERLASCVEALNLDSKAGPEYPDMTTKEALIYEATTKGGIKSDDWAGVVDFWAGHFCLRLDTLYRHQDEIPTYDAQVFSKKDKYSAPKIRKQLGRSIQAFGIEFKVFWLFFFAEVDEAFAGKANAARDADCAVSTCFNLAANPMFADMDEVHKLMEADSVLATDARNWDKHMAAYFIEQTLRLCFAHWSAVPGNIMEGFIRSIVHTTMLMPDGTGYKKHAGIPSGFPGTLHLNSIINFVLSTIAWQGVCRIVKIHHHRLHTEHVSMDTLNFEIKSQGEVDNRDMRVFLFDKFFSIDFKKNHGALIRILGDDSRLSYNFEEVLQCLGLKLHPDSESEFKDCSERLMDLYMEFWDVFFPWEIVPEGTFVRRGGIRLRDLPFIPAFCGRKLVHVNALNTVFQPLERIAKIAASYISHARGETLDKIKERRDGIAVALLPNLICHRYGALVDFAMMGIYSADPTPFETAYDRWSGRKDGGLTVEEAAGVRDHFASVCANGFDFFDPSLYSDPEYQRVLDGEEFDYRAQWTKNGWKPSVFGPKLAPRQ